MLPLNLSVETLNGLSGDKNFAHFHSSRYPNSSTQALDSCRMTLCCILDVLEETSRTTNSDTRKKRPFLKGILTNKRKTQTKSPQTPSLLEKNSESKAAHFESTTWDMDEMKLVGEVIREDFVKPLSKDMVQIHQNIVEPLHNGCKSDCFDDSFAGEIDADVATLLHQKQTDCEKFSQGASTKKAANFATSPILIKKTYSLGIRSNGTKKSRKNGMPSQSKARGKKQLTRRRSSANLGKKNLIKVRKDKT